MHIGGIIQARMGSQRFPGKVLHHVAGKPLLQYVLERVARCRSVETFVVATSADDHDTPIEEFCQQYRIACYRGPLSNVAGRFQKVVGRYQFDAFVRINGDSPLLDQRLIDTGVDLFRRGDAEIVTNVLPRTYPTGQSVEVVSTATFKRGYEQMRDEEDFEHVTKFFYKHHEQFRIRNFASDGHYSGIHLSVDTPQEMRMFEAIVARMERPHWEYALPEVLQIYERVCSQLRRDGK